MKNILLCTLTLTLTFPLALTAADTCAAPADLQIQNLRCEYLTNPIGIDANPPRLSWTLSSAQRAQKQSAYRILVASSLELLQQNQADLWDTGKLTSDQTIEITYQGKPLTSRMQCHWKVRVWDTKDCPAPWSQPATWSMGLLKPADWSAQWIDNGKPLPEKLEDFYKNDPAPLFRKPFTAKKPVRSAHLYITALGYYQARLNGQKIGDHVLDPAWTTYDKRILYSVFDVTNQLQKGDNCLAVTLGNGWYNPLPMKMWGWLNLRDHLPTGRPCFIAQLEVKHTDGSTQTILSDTSWKHAPGPILRNDVYLGELYDARLEQTGYDSPGFDDSTWKNAHLAQNRPAGALRRQMQPPIKAFTPLRPVALTEPQPNVYVFDLGKNFAGWIRLNVQGAAGQKVTLRYGELLHPDGRVNVMTAICGQIKKGGWAQGGPGAPPFAEQADTYILKGNGPETYSQTFTFHGFRFVEIAGLPQKPSLDSLQGLPLYTDLPRAGQFHCSNDLFNKIQQACVNTFLSNIFGLQSDCPGREKFGYGGDLVATANTFLYNFDVAAFYTKSVQDLADAARPNGALTNTAPYVGIDQKVLRNSIPGDVGWGLAHPYVLTQLHTFYGNRKLLRDQYPVAKTWVDFLLQNKKVADKFTHFADHEAVERPPREFCSHAQFYYNVALLANLAKTLGNTNDAQHYRQLADEMKNQFVKRFRQKDAPLYGSGNQSCQTFALHYDLTAPQDRRPALDALLTNIKDHDDHLTTGIFTTAYMMGLLTNHGSADVAYRIANQRTAPGWGYMIENDATTIWEHWPGSDNTFSNNHPMFGSVSEWFFAGLAGIKPDPDKPGFKHFSIAPAIVPELNYVHASYNSIHGPIVANWKRQDANLTFNLSIPANTTAAFTLPTNNPNTVTEAGQPLTAHPDITLLEADKHHATFLLPSGDYHLKTPACKSTASPQ